MSSSSQASAPTFLGDGGRTGALIRSHDWSATPLGPLQFWPPGLRAVAGLVLGSPLAMVALWGPDLIQIYNDAYAAVLGSKHPKGLGQSTRECWPELRAFNEPIYGAVLRGESRSFMGQELAIERDGRSERAWFDLAFSPLRDEAGAAVGVLVTVVETTERVLAERRQAFRLALEDRMRDLAEAKDLTGAAAELLGRHLSASRVGYAEIDPADGAAVVERDWTAEGVASVAGRLRVESFGEELAAELRAGRTIRVDDAATDRLAQGEGALGAFSAIAIRATVDVPLVKDGRFIAVLFVHSAEPRQWTGDEVALVEEVAERTWAAVERGRAKAELRESEARHRALFAAAERRAAELRAVLESMPDAVYIGGAEGVILANQPALDQLGFATREELNRNVATLAEEIRTRDAETGAPISVEDQAFTRALNGERVVQDVRVRHRLNGEDRIVRCAAAPVVIDGRVISAVAVNTDVTDKRRVEERLRELNATLEAQVAERTAELRLHRDIIEAHTTPICAFDSELRLTVFNRAYGDAFLRVFRQRVESGDDLLALLPPDQAPVLRRFMERALAGEAFMVSGEFGSPALAKTHWELRFAPLRDETGKISGAFYHAHDVTERVQAEAELRAAQEALRQSQKMEAVGQLTGGIAHDFNNLLGAVVGGFNLIRRRPDDPERVRRIADQGLAAAERGARLTGQLLAFSRAQRIELKPVVVADVVEGMRDMLGRTLGPMVRLKVELDDARAPVLSDPVQLEMSVLNLAINARDAMPEGGALTIGAKASRIDRDPELAPGEYVELSVADTGLGMPPEVAARAFDPFFTTKGVGKGTGLGLSQVYGIAKQAGGVARIKSAPGAGTVVRIVLPRHASQAAPDGAQSAPDEGPGVSSRRVLVVDDDDDFRRMLVESLRELGCVVTEAADGLAGLAALDAAELDLMLVDFAMPDMNGAEVAEAARSRRPGLPILFASGYSDTAAIEAVVGVDAFILRKPFTLDQLQAALNAALGEGAAAD